MSCVLTAIPFLQTLESQYFGKTRHMLSALVALNSSLTDTSLFLHQPTVVTNSSHIGL